MNKLKVPFEQPSICVESQGKYRINFWTSYHCVDLPTTEDIFSLFCHRRYSTVVMLFQGAEVIKALVQRCIKEIEEYRELETRVDNEASNFRTLDSEYSTFGSLSSDNPEVRDQTDPSRACRAARHILLRCPAKRQISRPRST